jgi:serine/threonine protein kinase
VAQCPKCKTSYPADVRQCPKDGSSLAVSVVSPQINPNAATDRTFDAGVTPAPKSATPRPVSSTVAGKSGGAMARTATPLPADALPPPIDPDDIKGDLDELKAGTQVGEYQVTGKLGQGGMGTVYSGVHPVIGKKVAIKVLNATLSHDASIVQRFVQEARSVNQIGHRNIVDIFAFGQLPAQHGARQYFVMEFLPGKSLSAKLKEGPLPYGDAFGILGEVCDALVAAHAEGIVHRDLKPDNIYLAENKAGDRTVKLLDFGIAKLLNTGSEPGQPVSQTRTGVPMGTPLYMSPEQCLGKPVDSRTDVYSLGVIMFEIFTGRLPFPGPSYIETVNGHLSSPPPRPTELCDIPVSLEELILKAMAKDAADRPQSVVELRGQLQIVARELGAELTQRRTSSGLMPVPGQSTPLRSTPAPRSAGAVKRGASPALVYGGIAVAAAAVVAVIALGLKPKKSDAETQTPVVAAAKLLKLQVVTSPPGASVTIGGKKQPFVTPYPFEVPWAKEVAVHVELAGYKPHDEQLTLADGEDARAVSVTLDPLNVPGGQLQARSNAKRATWTLDGKVVGDGVDALKIDDVRPGAHKLRVEAKGFETREETIQIQSRQLASLEWSLAAASSGHHHSAPPKPATPAAATPAATKPAAKPAASDDDNATSGWPPK